MKILFGALLGMLMGIALCIPTQAATKANLKKKLQAATSLPICKFIHFDFNKDGKKEAIGIASNEVNEFGYMDAQVWYVTGKSCQQIAEICGWGIHPSAIKKYSVKNTYIFTFRSSVGLGGWDEYAFSFDGDKAVPVENMGVSLSYLGKNQFCIYNLQYDVLINNDSGKVYAPYYSKWDGKKLVEYGGLKISQAQLKKAKNGTSILKQIQKKGTIGDIYYRANGLIFVNYTSGGENCNVELRLKNGKVSYVTRSDYGETKLDKATDYGIIQKNITDCVTYPKTFPVK